jgi:hypothetical protein
MQIKLRVTLRSFITAKNSAMSGLTANNLPVACGVGAATCTMGRVFFSNYTAPIPSVAAAL